MSRHVSASWFARSIRAVDLDHPKSGGASESAGPTGTRDLLAEE
jgi:hypothetical protein